MRGNCSIFPAFVPDTTARNEDTCSQCGFAHPPDPLTLIDRALRNRGLAFEALCGRDECCDLSFELLTSLGSELTKQEALPLRKEFNVVGHEVLATHVLDQQAIESFEANGCEVQD